MRRLQLHALVIKCALTQLAVQILKYIGLEISYALHILHQPTAYFTQATFSRKEYLLMAVATWCGIVPKRVLLFHLHSQ